ncbi:VanW family protein [Sporolactobacillus shoreicorticis]|uniref:VanW family protein n=1 Tax=Sporolactobacillus shoreicorticis TaxID=1923877 RepID=A0ABW5S315_9BACL|nr:VanW family protein [Sporolactobacillus shoreicorticis]MCO7125851.1 VanW family protein [Sporolactobacillus shoreicorticis]
MRLLMLAGILLLAQPQNNANALKIMYHKDTIATVHRTEFTHPFASLLNQDQYDQLVDHIAQKVDRAPLNAKIDDQGAIIPGKNGHKLYRSAFKNHFYRYYYSHGSAKMRVPLIKDYPKVDAELLAHICVQRISSYATFFNAGNESRAHNIDLAAKALDSHVVFPNETFSFNQTVGMRTKKKGYRSAPIIVRGEFSEGVGGGICQVSSTLFNAADRAGLKIVERYSHSRRVPYVPSGRDATVSWYGPDFRFKNTYNQPILIRAHKYGGSISFALYSSDMINVAPRKVPGASTHLPKEIHRKKESLHSSQP